MTIKEVGTLNHKGGIFSYLAFTHYHWHLTCGCQKLGLHLRRVRSFRSRSHQSTNLPSREMSCSKFAEPLNYSRKTARHGASSTRSLLPPIPFLIFSLSEHNTVFSDVKESKRRELNYLKMLFPSCVAEIFPTFVDIWHTTALCSRDTATAAALL